jgi:hypothetical protein
MLPVIPGFSLQYEKRTALEEDANSFASLFEDLEIIVGHALR